MSHRKLAICVLALFTASAQAAPSPAMIELRRHLTDASINTLTFHNIDEMFETLPVPTAGKATSMPKRIAPLDFTYRFEGREIPASEFAERSFTNALLILKDGRIVHEQYLNGNHERTHFLSMSVAKSITSILIGMAVADGSIASIDDPIVKYATSLKGSGYEGVSIRDALMMRSGVDWNERYDFGKESPMQQLHDEAIVQNKIRFTDPAASLKRKHEPGKVFNYSTVETGVLGLVLEGAVRKPLPQYMAERWWKRAGMESGGFWLADGEPGVGRAVNGMGFNAVLRDFGRIGQMMLDGGKANGAQLLPSAWVREATVAAISEPTNLRTDLGYQYQWWTFLGSPAYMAVGLQGQRIFVDPSTRTVIVKLSYFPPGEQRAEQETDVFLRAAASWTPR
ncbi:MAG: serine hydrolase [Steroidobacteraceae bacterium]